ncbi:MAG TPA: 3-dehydroquinate synthase [Eubacteriaceae bacterium]|nr:3-dehydroquinate synthase [Eubacteriaceae bacterium]
MHKIHVSVKREQSYDIAIEQGITKNLRNFKEVFFKYEKVIVISDTNVAKRYAKEIVRQIERFGCKVHDIIIETGEHSKDMDHAKDIFYHLSEFGVTRSDLIVALGGGVVGDLAGFCASTYLRGVDFIQMPTTLLAQVDSSIGGKVGINLSKGKNLVGSFYQPKLVAVDPDVLQTLPKRVYNDGMAEVIKYGCIYDASLFYEISQSSERSDDEKMQWIISRCCEIKAEVIQKDELEGGLRKVLNFGHTIGHVIETYFNYEEYTHGEAVAIGMYYITLKSEKKGITKAGTAAKIKEILEKNELPYQMPHLEEERVHNILFRDKKFSGDKITLVLLKEIGETVFVKMDKKQLLEFIG